MDQVCCHGNGQDRYACKDVQDRSVGYREDMHRNDSDEAKNNEEIIFDLAKDFVKHLRLKSNTIKTWCFVVYHTFISFTYRFNVSFICIW